MLGITFQRGKNTWTTTSLSISVVTVTSDGSNPFGLTKIPLNHVCIIHVVETKQPHASARYESFSNLCVSKNHVSSMEELFIDAARDGNLQEVRNLLQRGTDVNATNAYGDSGLMKASFHDRTDIVKELLRHDGVDVNHWNVEGETALMLASCKGHVNIVEELLKQETLDVNHRNKNHKTALIGQAI